MATTSGNDPLSPGRQPGCDTCRISGLELAADLRLERSASGLTVRFPHPVGLSARMRIGAECGNRTRVICLEGRGPKPLDQPRSNGGLCVSLYGSPSPCNGSKRAPDFGRGFSGGRRADPSSRYLSAPGLAPEARPNQNSIAVTRGINCPSNAPRSDGLWEPAAVQVSRSFLTAMNMGRAFYAPRIPKSSVVSTLNVGHNTSRGKEVL